MELFFVSILITLITVGLVFFIQWYYKGLYERSKNKFSDAEIFKMMAKANHFLTAQQLAAVSALDKKEARDRLAYLAMVGAIQRYQDSTGVNLVYHLKEELPEDDVLPISIQGLTDQQIVEAVLEYSDDYQITIAELAIVFGLEIKEAKKVLKRLKKSGLVGQLWKGWSLIYVIKKPLLESTPALKKGTFSEKMAIPSSKMSLKQEQVKLKIPDADVLNLAIEHKGRLTAALLCLKLQISMEEAQFKLEELYEQGAFIMDVNERDAIIEYHLRDKNLLA
ncbi:hypothetical protein [Aureispira anguillae]|nr:hypothetical protein [Aureispira anguillae]